MVLQHFWPLEFCHSDLSLNHVATLLHHNLDHHLQFNGHVFPLISSNIDIWLLWKNQWLLTIHYSFYIYIIGNFLFYLIKVTLFIYIYIFLTWKFQNSLIIFQTCVEVTFVLH